MPRILITGVAGFLGGRFAKWLLENICGAEVDGIDDFSCGYQENVPFGVHLHVPHEYGFTSGTDRRELTLGEGSLRNSEAWDQYDYVFHFAAYAAEGLSPFIRQYNYKSNLLATAEIVNLCIEQGVKRLVFTSSMAAYGRGVTPLDESAWRQTLPLDPYGCAKLACEHDIRCANAQHGLDYCLIRPHNLYGPGQSIFQRYRNVLGLWMRARIEDKPLLVYGDGLQRRAFSWIDDCLPCLWQAAVAPEASRQLINLGGAKPITIREAAELVADVTGGGEIEHREPRHEVKDAWCTTAKSERLLGYRERTPFREGLSQMWEWAQETYARYPERREPGERFTVEVEKGLYPYWAGLLSHPNAPT